MIEALEYKEDKIRIDNVDLFYRIVGEGKPVVIIHGWGANSSFWEGFINSTKGYKFIVPDLPGFGNTPSPDKVWGSEDYAEIIIKFIDALKLQKFSLIGHSFGGGIALIVVSRLKGRVERLVLCDAAIVREERLSLRQRVSKFLAHIGSNVISKTPIYPFLEKMAYKLAGAYDYYYVKSNPIMRDTFRKVISEDLSHLLVEVGQPCLIVWGSKDKATPVSDAIHFHEIIKDSELKIIKGVGHNPYRKKPEETAEAVINFLNK